MTNSAYVPDLFVQVSYDGSAATSRLGWTWSDLSQRVAAEAGVSIGYGRSDQLSQPDANTLTVIFDDGDGALSPGGAQHLRIGLPIRVYARPVSSNAIFTRFVGFITGTRLVWPNGQGEHAQIQVQASSRKAVLGRARNIQDRTSAVVLAAGATSYWPMTEEIPGTEKTIPQSPPWFPDDQPLMAYTNLADSDTAIRYGWPTMDESHPMPDGLPVANMYSPTDRVLEAVAEIEPIPAGTAWSVSVMTRVPKDRKKSPQHHPIKVYSEHPDRAPEIISAAQLFWGTDSENNHVFAIQVIQPNGAGGLLQDLAVGAYGNDRGPWHLYTLTCSAGANPTLRAYQDGKQIAQLTMTNPAIDVGAVAVGHYTAANLDPNQRTEAGRLAVYAGIELSAATVAEMAETIVKGFSDDTPLERIQRLADFVNVTGVVGDSGDTPILPQDVTGTSALQLMQDVADTDGGVLYDSKDGDTVYRGRGARYTAAVGLTLDVAAQEVNADLSPGEDLSELINDVTSRATDDSLSIRRTDTTSIDAYGYSGTEIAMVTNSAPHIIARADWTLHRYSTPGVRVPTLAVELVNLVDSQQIAVLNADVGTLVKLNGLPANVVSMATRFFVEGWTETWVPESCVIAFNVSDASALLNTFVLDDAARGALDSAYVLAY